ncbi:Rho termination factor N-terminal domain-containing protein [Gordonia asplenii]|nr:Rho termination factor N-terminal domain-containing protein [Gordonia asplenii]
MARVPWGDLEGDDVERFVAALILLDHPDGSRITPAQGDGGVDIKVPNGDGFDVYQVKKYNSALTSSQETEVRKSWDRVNDDFGADNIIKGWFLVMPWDPTEVRENWLAQLTTGASFPIKWLGKAHLDGMCSRHLNLVKLFFEDGAERINELLTNLVALSADIGVGGLDVFATRYVQLQQELDKLSPFYRYRLEVVPANEVQPLESIRNRPVFTAQEGLENYRKISDDYYIRTSVSAISVEAEAFNPTPMMVTLRLEDSPDVRAFLDFGVAPESPVAGEVVDAVMPPGLTTPAGPVEIGLTDQVVLNSWENLELLMTRISGEEGGDDSLALELSGFVTTEGAIGRQMVGSSGAVGIVLTFHRHPLGYILGTWAKQIAGAAPHQVLPSLVFAARLWSGGQQVEIRVPHGPSVIPPTYVAEDATLAESAQDWIEIVQDLIAVQRWTPVPLKVPHRGDGAEVALLRRAAELTAADEPVARPWDSLRIVQHHPDIPMAGEWELLAFGGISISLDGSQIDLNVTVRQHCERVEAIETGPGYVVVRPVGDAPMREVMVEQHPDIDGRVVARPLTHEAAGTGGVRDLRERTVTELRDLARALGLSGYSGLRKSELVDLIRSAQN